MTEHKNLLIVLGEWWETRKRRAGSAATQPHSGGGPRFLRWFLPNPGTLILIALLIATQSIWARSFAAPNAPGPSATTVNYQGRLADDAGVPLTGTYGMSFALYDAATGGNLIWGPEAHPAVPVSDGLFSVGLGSQTSGGIPTTTWNGDRYLEITVGGETLAPRELIRSVPIAGMALTVPDGAVRESHIADGAVTQEKLGDDISLEPPDGSITTAKLADGAVTTSKVALSHGYLNGGSGTFSLNTNDRTVTGMSFSVNTTTHQVLYLIITADGVKSSTSGPIVGSVFVNGSRRGKPLVLDGNMRATVSTSVQVNLSPGSHTVDFRARVESGHGSYLFSGNSVMTYIMFAQ
jgi:hypothetical protein